MIRILRIYKAFTFFPIQSEVFIRFCRSSYISIAQHFQPSNLSFSVYCFHSARTHFTVSFMEKSGEVCRRRLPEGGSPQCSGQLHVLAVDDSHVDRKVIERLLRISSCKVTAVESGTRALQFLGLEGAKTSGIDGLKVNLIMTDYSMPGMTGYELLKKIKESSDYREVPVVVMSSENIFARIDRCLEEGAEEFIVKPVKLSDVKRLKDFVITKGKSDETRGRRSEKRKLRDEENGFSDNPARNCEVSTQLRKKPRLCEMN